MVLSPKSVCCMWFVIAYGAVLPAEELWYQLDHYAGYPWARSHGTASGPDNFDNWSADDFVIPAGEIWQIDSVDVIGEYFIGEEGTFDVYVYLDNQGIPGQILRQRLDLAVEHGEDGRIHVPLVETVRLEAGHYWICVQANLLPRSVVPQQPRPAAGSSGPNPEPTRLRRGLHPLDAHRPVLSNGGCGGGFVVFPGGEQVIPRLPGPLLCRSCPGGAFAGAAGQQ